MTILDRPKNWLSINDKFKYIAVLFLLLLSGFLAVSLIGYTVAQRSISAEISDNTLPLISDNIYSEIQHDLLTPILTAAMMAQDTFLRDWVMAGEQDPEAMIRFLKETQEQNGTITAFFVSETSRKYYHPSGILKTISNDDPQDSWYFRVRQMKDDYEINVDWDTADLNSLTVFINYRIVDYDGNYIGTAGVGLAMTRVMELMDSYQKRYGQQVMFVDEVGAVTLHATGYEGAKNIREIVGNDVRAARILADSNVSLTFERNGKKIYLNSRMVPEFGWYLLVEQTGSEADVLITRSFILSLSLSLALTLIVLLLASVILGRYQKYLEVMATTDKLTGAVNRHAFEMVFSQALKLVKRRAQQISVVMIDVDHFKAVNDVHGHQAGDLVLIELVNAVQDRVRETDTFCRWGGEEFLLLLPDCDLQQASNMAEAIRTTVLARSIVFADKEINITVSCGVAEAMEGETEESLIQRTDAALYQAKSLGRNRVEIAT